MSGSRLVLLLLAAALGVLGNSRGAHAQAYPPTTPPRIYTIPAEVQADQPFQIAIETMAIAGTIGPWGVLMDPATRTIEISFEYFCGWLCPGPSIPTLTTFHVDQPGLPEGDYIIRLVGGASGEVPLRISAATAAAVPLMDYFAIGVLVTLMLAAAVFRLRPTLNGNAFNHG